MSLGVLCDLCSLVVGSVNQHADMTRPLSLITHFSLFACQHGLGHGRVVVATACCFCSVLLGQGNVIWNILGEFLIIVQERNMTSVM